MAAGGGVTIAPEARRRARGQQARLRADIDETIALLQGLKATGFDLIARASLGGFDGFGAGHGPGDGGRSSTRSDPTASAAAALEQLRLHPAKADPLAHHISTMLDEVSYAVGSARRAEAARQAAVRVPAREAEPGERRAPGCVNCDRYEIWSAVAKAGRCESCYMYWYRKDRDAPEHVVRARPEVSGKRERIRIDPTRPGSPGDGHGPGAPAGPAEAELAPGDLEAGSTDA